MWCCHRCQWLPLLPLTVVRLDACALSPQVSGVNFEEMIEAAVGEKLDLNKPLVDYESGNDVITVWLE